MPGSPKLPPDVEKMFGDLFSDFFGRLAPPGPDVTVATQITEAEAASGLEREVAYRHRLPCEPCGGRGSLDPAPVRKVCQACGGRGTSSHTVGFFAVQRPCGTCRGVPSTLANPCATCQGTGELHVDGTLNVVIPAAIANGTTLRIPDHGNVVADGTRGELLVSVLVGDPLRHEHQLDAMLFPPQLPTAVAIPTPKQRAARNAALLFTVFFALVVLTIAMTAF